MMEFYSMPAPTQAAYIEHTENLVTGAYSVRHARGDQSSSAAEAAEAWRRFRGDP